MKSSGRENTVKFLDFMPNLLWFGKEKISAMKLLENDIEDLDLLFRKPDTSIEKLKAVGDQFFLELF